MTDVVLPVVGAAVGFVVGGPQGAMMGAQIGMMAASAFTRVKLPTQEGPRLADLRGQTSTYGGHIPKLYGTMRIAGNVIWSTDIKEVKVESTQNGGGKGGGGRTSQTSITYEYYITLAIALCEGEIDEITRVWADAKILTEDILLSNQGKYNVNLGSEDQDVDDIMAKYIDSSILPAYEHSLCCD